MPIVSLDSNIVDLLDEAFATTVHVDCAESQDAPPRFSPMHSRLEAEVWAVYWLIALAPTWRSTLYTFSDHLFVETARARHATTLLHTAFDVLAREEQPEEYRVPYSGLMPEIKELVDLGLKPDDARHVADAIGLRCSYLLTNDRQLRNRSVDTEREWDLKLRRPSEFLIEAVRAGAPWLSRIAWPWETIERILGDDA